MRSDEGRPASPAAPGTNAAAAPQPAPAPEATVLRARFLAEASAELASSLDYETTLAAVARLAVPRLADWCVVYILEGRALRNLAVAHADPAKVEWAREVGRRYPPDPDAPAGVARVLRSGRPELVEEVAPEMVAAAARDEDHLRLLLGLGLRSVIVVPLAARGAPWGRSPSSWRSPAAAAAPTTWPWRKTSPPAPPWRWTTPGCTARPARPPTASPSWRRPPAG
jgi:hypothetical protein